MKYKNQTESFKIILVFQHVIHTLYFKIFNPNKLYECGNNGWKEDDKAQFKYVYKLHNLLQF